jgi:hypothetical protein
MLLEYAEASFECMEHRFRQLRGLACVKRVLQEYALANDVGLQFGDVPVGVVKMLLFPSAIHGFVPRTAVGRAPAQANRIGPGPYGLGTCVRRVLQPTPQLYRIWGLFPLNSDCDGDRMRLGGDG